MAKNVDYSELAKYTDTIQKQMRGANWDGFVESCAKELAARLLRKVIKRTPKDTGNLQKGWTTGEIRREGNNYIIEVINPVKYAEYVEYGHRQEPGRYVPAIGKRLKASWVEGRFMMTISAQEVQNIAPKVLEAKLKKKLSEVFQ